MNTKIYKLLEQIIINININIINIFNTIQMDRDLLHPTL
jgi:hypothetical protein